MSLPGDTRSSRRGPTLPVVRTSVIPPDAGGVLTALARVGYDLEVALADIVDNSLDAQADTVLIRFLRTSGRLTSLVIVDNGHGIPEAGFDAAMGFGADTGKENSDLGKYGMGLKSASFSQSQAVTVLSGHGGEAAGRRWTTDNIRSGWICEHIDPTAAADHLSQDWGQLVLNGSGTVIRWDDLDAFRVARDRADGVLEDYFRRIALHLGLHFHRFLAAGRLQILVDAVNEETGDRGSARPIAALDPFGYPETGRRSYPRGFRLDIAGVGALDVEAHIWPRRSRHSGYILGGGKVSQRQGFYFYRNDRLIQAGGWNGWRDDAEPHSSLARVRVDLPGDYDDAFGLNLQKSSVSVPAGFFEALVVSRSDGTSFAQYLRDAIETYRRRSGRPAGPEAPLVPGAGITKSLARRLRRMAVVNSGDPARSVTLAWKTLPESEFFRLDRDNDTLHLNTRYRSAVMLGKRGGPADAPLVKTLLFLLLETELSRERSSATSRDWLTKCQTMLVAAARTQER